MIHKTIIIYTIVDDILKAIKHKEDKRQKMTDSEVITIALIAAIVFAGNIEKARVVLRETGLIPDMLEKSRLCLSAKAQAGRRIHALSDLIVSIFHQLGIIFKQANISMEYILDSFPVPVCDNIRIKRCRVLQSEEYRGYTCLPSKRDRQVSAKRRYFSGVRVHILATSNGIPVCLCLGRQVEIAFFPGSAHDSNALHELPFYLPEGSEIYSDSAYTNYTIEDDLREVDKIKLSPMRKENSKRWDEPPIRWYKQYIRKKIETVFSEISNFFPKKIHACLCPGRQAVTFDGFLLKVLFFIIGFTLNKAFC